MRVLQKQAPKINWLVITLLVLMICVAIALAALLWAANHKDYVPNQPVQSGRISALIEPGSVPSF